MDVAFGYARNRDGRPTEPAGEIRDAGGWVGLQTGVHVGNLGEVLGGEVAEQPATVEVALSLDRVFP